MIGEDRILATVTIKAICFKGNHVEEQFASAWDEGDKSIYKKVGREW
jgi:hypothetical protein